MMDLIMYNVKSFLSVCVTCSDYQVVCQVDYHEEGNDFRVRNVSSIFKIIISS